MNGAFAQVTTSMCLHLCVRNIYPFLLPIPFRWSLFLSLCCDSVVPRVRHTRSMAPIPLGRLVATARVSTFPSLSPARALPFLSTPRVAHQHPHPRTPFPFPSIYPA